MNVTTVTNKHNLQYIGLKNKVEIKLHHIFAYDGDAQFSLVRELMDICLAKGTQLHLLLGLN